ncbi:cytochrome P450 [Nocardia sp. CWNU-33]|uniref:cytochrome P450 n=1 Tax=Nocardia sp. CWNU-33 TaxID=3392117 RepID=UPI00398ED098
MPVAPGRLPVVGHLPVLARRPTQFFRSLSSVGDIVRVDLANWPVFFLTEAELVQEVLAGQASSFERGRFFERSRRLFGDGLSVSDGELHRQQRRMIQPAFHRARIAMYTDTMQRCVKELTESWRPGQIIAADRAMRALTLTIIAETMFSSPLGRPAIEAAHRCLPVIMANTVPRALLPQALDRWPLPINRRFDSACAGLRNVIEHVVREYRVHEVDNGDLLSLLMAARDADTGAAMSDRQVLDEALNIMVAGTETTATMLSWAVHHLASNTEVQQRLCVELDGIDRVDGEGAPKMPYLDSIINEITRLYPVMLLTRRPIVPVTLGTVEIPAGVELAYSLYALHRDDRYFSDPDRFDPDRWLSDDGNRRKAFLPFGLGRHRCLGEGFSWVEMTLTLAAIFSSWEVLPAPGHPVREKFAAIPQPDELFVTVRRRGRTSVRSEG